MAVEQVTKRASKTSFLHRKDLESLLDFQKREKTALLGLSFTEGLVGSHAHTRTQCPLSQP
jgi:hypothetical protein